MKDPCSKLVMDVAERYVKGLASDAELTAARTTKVVANPAGAAASVAARAVMQPVAGVAVWAAACASANAAGIAAWASMVPPDSAAAWATWAAALVVIDPVQNRVRQEADAAWADVLSIVRSRQRAQFLKLVEGS